MSPQLFQIYQNARLSTAKKTLINHHHARCFSTSSSPAKSPLRSPEFIRRGFSDCPDITSLRILHSLYISTVGCNHRSIFSSNTLISAYSRFCVFHHARKVFDGMPSRNTATWNAMISGYISGDLVGAAADLLHLMRSLGLPPGGFALSSLVSGGLGLPLHPLLLKTGDLADVFVSTSLLHCYGSHGFISDAHHLFDEMPHRNLITWTAMIVSFSENEDPATAVRAFRAMTAHGVRFNENTLTAALSSCSALADEPLGLQVLALVVRSGFESDLSVSNSLVAMLGGFSRPRDALRVFSAMPERDTISWNSVISASSRNGLRRRAFRLFAEMLRVRSTPNPTTLSSLLVAPDPSTEDVGPTAGLVHGLALRLGLYGELCLCNSLLAVYSEAGMPSSAAGVFSEMPERDSVSWNSMLTGLARDGSLREALGLFARLVRHERAANEVTFSSLFSALADHSGSVSDPARVLHGMATVAGLDTRLAVGNALVSLYGRLGRAAEAVKVSAAMPVRDVVTWNSLIGIHPDDPATATALFRAMRAAPIVNHISVINLLGSFLSPRHGRDVGAPVHGFVLRSGLDSDSYIRNSLITMYADCGDFRSGRAVYSENPDLASANAMMAGYAHNGRGELAIGLFRGLLAGVRIDHFSLSATLAAAAGLAAGEEGRQAHCVGLKLGFGSNIHVVNAAMDMYGKCGEMGDLLRLMPGPRDRTRVTWNVALSALSRHGMSGEAVGLFREMAEVGPRPDRATFASVLTGCSHGGLVEEGLTCFASMEAEFGVRPGAEHYGCVADMLGRAGRIDEAEKFVSGAGAGSGADNGYVWRSLLAMCRVHRSGFDSGRRAAGRLVEIDPTDETAYVLYSNVCAGEGRWEERESVRREMGMGKRPGCSWVKWAGGVEWFGSAGQTRGAGDGEIYRKLEELRRRVGAAGYVADTWFDMHDTDEEQKEEGLWGHCERLALAFGLTRLPAGVMVKIFMNLRVCGDCHAFFKVVCSVLGRVVLLRDTHRFHMFHQGACSCGDFW